MAAWAQLEDNDCAKCGTDVHGKPQYQIWPPDKAPSRPESIEVASSDPTRRTSESTCTKFEIYPLEILAPA
eukprot:1148007-Pelagomonas_calceolata.AAC.1